MKTTKFITVGNAHWYPSPKKLETWYPSVTTILGDAFPKGIGFSQYLANQQSWESSQEILKDAGKRGTNVHKATEILELGGTLTQKGSGTDYTDEEWQMIEGFVLWHKKFNPDRSNVVIEQSLCSDKLKAGGTIDRVYMIDGRRVLLDVKTSSAVHDNYWAQTAAYVALWEEKHPKEPIDCTAILRTAPRRKDKYEYVVHERDEIMEDLQVFKAVQKIWNYLNPKAKPKILELPLELSL